MTAKDARIKLKSHASPAAAQAATRFFKTGPGQYGEGDTFIGIKVPTLRTVSRSFRALPLDEIGALLNSPIHEERHLALMVCFFLNGNALVGVWKDRLIARLGPDAYEDAKFEPHVGEFDITGKPMKGWVLVQPEGVDDDDQLKDWIRRAEEFVGTLPVK